MHIYIYTYMCVCCMSEQAYISAKTFAISYGKTFSHF